MVHILEHDGRDHAAKLLREYGAHDIRYYGDTTITELDVG